MILPEDCSHDQPKRILRLVEGVHPHPFRSYQVVRCEQCGSVRVEETEAYEHEIDLGVDREIAATPWRDAESGN